MKYLKGRQKDADISREVELYGYISGITISDSFYGFDRTAKTTCVLSDGGTMDLNIKNPYLVDRLYNAIMTANNNFCYGRYKIKISIEEDK